MNGDHHAIAAYESLVGLHILQKASFCAKDLMVWISSSASKDALDDDALQRVASSWMTSRLSQQHHDNIKERLLVYTDDTPGHPAA